MKSPIFSRRGMPIRLQIVALLIGMQFLAHAANVLVVSIGTDGFGSSLPTRMAGEAVGPLTTTFGIAEHSDPARTSEILMAAINSDQRLALEPDFQRLAEDRLNFAGRRFLRALADTLPDLPPERFGVAEAIIFDAWPWSMGNYKMGVEVADGVWLTFTPARDLFLRTFPLMALSLATMLLALPLAGLSIWAGGTLVAPLKRLAGAARRFSIDLNAEPATETGPAEVRTVARTFNAMRDRIKSLVDARAYTLAAISHDLRTPLTRLRLRVDGLSPETDREKLLQDIGTMETMIESALGYIRNQQAPLSHQPFDIAALVQSVCDDSVGADRHLEYDGPDRLTMIGDPGRVGRAVANVIGNAVKYATETEVLLREDPSVGAIRLVVADNGPGVAEEYREAMFEPFRRGDHARSAQAATGFGLGLSIARDIVERHSGMIYLADNSPKGLRVVMVLPKDAAGTGPMAAVGSAA